MELPESMETTSTVEIRAAVDNTGIPQWSTWSETRTFITLPDDVPPPPEPPPPVKPGKGWGKGGKK